MIGFTLSFEGNNADDHQLDFYDAAQAMLGFQRSLAITTHLVLNGKVITQAPSLKNAQILAVPPEAGSWEVIASIVGITGAFGAAIYKIGTAPKDTPIGHIMYSAYDYVISESLGFHVDYDKSLGQQYEELNKSKANQIPILEQSKFDSAIEKCENAIRDMHRPIIKSKTAEQARIIYRTSDSQIPFEQPLDSATFEHISETTRDDDIVELEGYVSSYNINTFKGRIFVSDERRPIQFELEKKAQSPQQVQKITSSLSLNAAERFDERAVIEVRAFKNRSKSGRLKSLYVVEVL